MNSEFNCIIQTWKGRGFVESHLESQGFMVHKTFQRFVVDYCSQLQIPCDVSNYWNACADEWVKSGTEVDSDARRFASPPLFRSDYLDNLFKETIERASTFPRPPIHPCILAFKEKERSSYPLFSESINSLINRRKAVEIKQHLPLKEDIQNIFSDFKAVVEKYASDSGFARAKIDKSDLGWEKNGYKKICRNGLVFYFGIENLRRSLRIGQLPLRFVVSHVNGTPHEILLDVGQFIVPGFDYYSTFDSPEEAWLGIIALISIFNVMSESFSDGKNC